MVGEEENKGARKKKRILYVDRSCNLKGTSLTRDFKTDIYCGLDKRIIRIIKEKIKENKKYHALVTHIPFTGNLETGISYGRSLSILAEIEKIDPKLIIIAYTGASMESFPTGFLIANSAADRIIKKSIDPEKDAQKILENLKDMFLRREKKKIIRKPKIKKEVRYITTELEIDYNNFRRPFTFFTKIAEEAEKYKGKVCIKREDKEGDLKLSLDNLVMLVYNGQAQILVEGESKEAENLVRKLYYALSSGKFENFQPK